MNNVTNKRTNLRRLLAGAAIVTGLTVAPTSFAGNYGGNCVPFQLSSHGGEAGVRTLQNTGNFQRTRGGHISGQFCGNGQITVELSKRHPGTTVRLHVNGYEYVFGGGDRGDRVVNHWYRRYYNIDLPYYEQQYSKKHKKHHKKRHHKRHSNKHHGYDSYYGDDYYDNSYGYDNKHYGHKPKRHGYGYNDNYGHKPKVHRKKHHHGHGIGPKPRLRIGSRLHRDAHKLRLPHRHKKEHVAYH